MKRLGKWTRQVETRRMERRGLAGVVLAGMLVLSVTAQATLVGYWKFNEGSGTTALDSSGNGFNGIINGTASYVTGPTAYGSFGTALFFDDSGGAHVDVGVVSQLMLTGTPYTVAWFQKQETGQRIINMDDGNDFSGGYSFSSGGPAVASATHNNGTMNNVSTTGVGPDWQHVAWVYDGASTLRFYSNATLNATFTITGGPLTTDGNDPLWFGGIPVHGQYYKGALDEIRIYNEALTQTQLGDLLSNEFVPPVPEPSTVTLLGIGLSLCHTARRRLKK